MKPSEMTVDQLCTEYRFYCGLMAGLFWSMNNCLGDDNKWDEKVERQSYEEVKQYFPELEAVRAELLRRNGLQETDIKTREAAKEIAT